jgi:hypothetical protein
MFRGVARRRTSTTVATVKLRADHRRLSRCFWAIIGATLAAVAGLPGTVGAADPVAPVSWEQWLRLAGVVDVAGPRGDGNLVAMAAGRLYLVTPDGATLPFAIGPDGYVGAPDSEQYLVVVPAAPALPDQSAGCSFAPDDVFILDLTSPSGIARVDATGHAGRFATISNVDGLWGIALDTVGRFDYRLLVAGTSQNRTSVFAVDCRGGVTTITDAAPAMEGGFAVAPAGFGQFGGDLIAADELGGQVWAIGPDGAAMVVFTPDLPTGGDTGVESLGYVPPGFGAGGVAYLADRGTPDNPFPGTDSILRLSSQALVAAGVQDGDLLVATEGGGLTVAIHCESTCAAALVAAGPTGGHIEGHITLVAG